jgi:multimeric flavodoxin WrbA
MNRRLFLGAAAASVAALPRITLAAEPAAGSVKIVGIAGSLRKGKSTYKAVELALESAKTVSPAISTDIIELSGLNLDPYIAVGSKSSDRPDDFPSVREKLVAPDVYGILMGSPVYMGIVSSPLKQLFERMLAFRQGGFPLKNKVGGAIAVGGGRNTGVELILQQTDHVHAFPGDAPGGRWESGGSLGRTMQSQGDDLSKDEGSLNTVRGVANGWRRSLCGWRPRRSSCEDFPQLHRGNQWASVHQAKLWRCSEQRVARATTGQYSIQCCGTSGWDLHAHLEIRRSEREIGKGGPGKVWSVGFKDGALQAKGGAGLGV